MAQLTIGGYTLSVALPDFTANYKNSPEVRDIASQITDLVMKLKENLDPHIQMIGGPGSIHPSAYQKTLHQLRDKINEIFNQIDEKIDDAHLMLIREMTPYVNTLVDRFEEYVGVRMHYENGRVILNKEGQEITEEDFERIVENYRQAVENFMNHFVAHAFNTAESYTTQFVNGLRA